MAPKTAPNLNIPASTQTVDVRIIDSTARIRQIPLWIFIKDPLPGHEFFDCVAYAFLVEHAPSGKKVLFDLGVRKDVESLAPAVRDPVMSTGLKLDVEEEIPEILGKSGIGVGDVDAIVWSHWHLDHSGNPSRFPATTELVVGPGFKKGMLPGYPVNPESKVLETDYQGRNLHELNFDTESNGLQLGRFRAIDYFDDGSFYLLDVPGHTEGHLCALARTTPDTFIFMGADTCHHGGSLRPTEYIPLPSELSPSPFRQHHHDHMHGHSHSATASICPGALLEAIHPKHSTTEPYYPGLGPLVNEDIAEAQESLEKMAEFDANENVLVIIAHDGSLMDVVDFFPKKANDWKEKGWKDGGKWKFLEDFGGVVDRVENPGKYADAAGVPGACTGASTT